MSKENVKGPIWKSRLAIIVIFLIVVSAFVGPVILIKSGWRPSKTANYGELIQPARPIQDVRLQTLKGQAKKFSDLKGKWTFVYFGSAECSSNSMSLKSPCERSLYKMRQVRLTQGRYLKRVQTVYIVTDSKTLDLLRFTLKEYPNMQVLTGSSSSIRQLTKQFAWQQTSPLDGDHRVYLIDPLGNLVMMYTGGADPSGMRKDLGRLLRHSKIG